MPLLDDPRARITAGPRWDALLDALGAAAEALAAPLSEEELALGWSEELRVAMLDATSANLQALKDEPTRPELLIGMVDGDELDADADDERRDATFLPDFAASSLLYAEQVLLATRALLELLARPLTEDDLAHGMTEETNELLRFILDDVLETLSAGEYLTEEVLDRWRNLLAQNGFERRAPDGAHSGFGASVGVGQIDLFPPGRCWEPICIYDPAFTRLAENDDER